MLKPAWPPYAELAIMVDHLWGHAAAGLEHDLLPGEETLTQVAMLSHARRRFPFTRFRGRLPNARRAVVRKFSLGEEGKTGADWNLLMFAPDGSRVSFRVQAKRLFPNGSFSEMKDTQTDRLISLSRRQGAIPLFGLYQGPQYAPNTSACNLPGANDRIGCVVRDAVGLKKAAPGTSSAAWQQQASLGVPLQCLAWCFCYSNLSAPSGRVSPLDPSTHGALPPTIDVEQARRVVTAAAFNRGHGLDLPESMMRSLVDAVDAPENHPDDLLGAYWDRHEGHLDDLDAEGRWLFEDVSHLVVIDSRIPGDDPSLSGAASARQRIRLRSSGAG